MLQTSSSIEKDGGERVKTEPGRRRDCSSSSPAFTPATLPIRCLLPVRTIGELIGLNSIREWAAGYVAAAGRVSQFARDHLGREPEATPSPTLPNPSTATP